jgi:hypothetical protein
MARPHCDIPLVNNLSLQVSEVLELQETSSFGFFKKFEDQGTSGSGFWKNVRLVKHLIPVFF